MGYSLRVAEDELEKLPKTQIPFSERKRGKRNEMQKMPHPESHVPRFRERVGTSGQDI